MINKKQKKENESRETARVEAFSDGVFAIAITLLILEIVEILHIQNQGGLLKSYLNHWQSFLAFFIGFCTILVCWINHHHLFTYIIKVDNKLLWVNGFVLLAITFTPFPTGILAEYLKTEGKTAIAIFGFNYFIISIASYCISSYVYSKNLIVEESREFFYCIKLSYAYSIIYTAIAVIVCLYSIPAAIVLYLILFGVFAFPDQFALKLLAIRKSRKNKLTIKNK